MRFSMRFNLRNPEFAGVQLSERYAAALEMVEWADGLGASTVSLSEHHASPDDLLPTPLPFMAAIATRTESIRLMIAALVAPLHDPLRLAEEIAVVDQLSKGRLDIVIGMGHDQATFDMFGIETRDRVRRITEMVTTLRNAFTGEPFEYRGRTVQVTPRPYQTGGPAIVMGGNSEGAARRAARIGDGFVPALPHVWEFYRDELLLLGKPDCGPYPGTAGGTVELANDPDEAWERLAPYYLHEANSHGALPVPDAEALRTSGAYRVLRPDEYVEELKAAPSANPSLAPMCGGSPPELAWESLRLFEREVLPKFN